MHEEIQAYLQTIFLRTRQISIPIILYLSTYFGNRQVSPKTIFWRLKSQFVLFFFNLKYFLNLFSSIFLIQPPGGRWNHLSDGDPGPALPEVVMNRRSLATPRLQHPGGGQRHRPTQSHDSLQILTWQRNRPIPTCPRAVWLAHPKCQRWRGCKEEPCFRHVEGQGKQ